MVSAGVYPGGAKLIRAFESKWEAYTRQFIMKHRLNGDQGRKAWDLCRDCEKIARSYLDTRRTDVDDWQQRLEASRSASVEEQAREKEKLDRRRTELVAPIDRIFEDRLKPGLDKLPTPKSDDTAAPQAK